MCTGSEQSLDRCPFNGWGSHNCVHLEDAGAVCEGTFMVPRPPPCVHTAKKYIYLLLLSSPPYPVTQSLIVTMLIMCLIMYLIIYLIMYLIIYLLMYLIIIPKGKRCATMIVINCYTSDSLVGATIF